ncbi:FAD-binding and (Fe-S)-binding domain-containing protein [Helicobacter turcicus]|uniref:D-lactate dehydrogenase (cytochrome) n=1 Tax=Helicobacter turcicus TaxID=2867412 RepID=A0ABS7JNN7_9HELI|nr:FAD-binding and (Fe-S)-binding domain-containing protein [Helicobacter turcicus]MBX7490992.1 FAD-binding oxidoreductase [Helicobacter turcicus]MBX7545881.1 FAD-binding oxidoreductase [Helicobacter turcicus]
MNFDSKFSAFVKEVKSACKEVFESYLLRYAFGVDASCYNYTPKLVINALNEEEVLSVLALVRKYGIAITFRAAGTSLSGQASSNSVLLIANKGFKGIKLNEDASIIECECGVIASEANEVLKPFGKKIGPDPATIATALMGGILNNNSSGMCCGVSQNSYHTIHSLRVVLLDGSILDTGDALSCENFCKTHKNLIKTLFSLREGILKDEDLKKLIKNKFKIKNTTGYSINALLDFSETRDIINHLFVGSEGTLGFVSKVRLKTIKDSAFKGCALLFFKNLEQTSRAVVSLARLPLVNALEMMDYACLSAVKDYEGVPNILKECKEGYTCLLLQSIADSAKELDKNLTELKEHLKDLKLAFEPLISTEQNEFDSWWKIRKGLLPIVAGARKKQTTVITEDLCFKIEDFCEGAELIKTLFEKYGFEGVIFGHALSGNLHFIITPNLNDQVQYENFSALVCEMSEKVSLMQGSIKAEHGTGRMVAPFVELEWGSKAYEINKAIKTAFDPLRLLNPDVIISDDKEIYKKNLKAMNAIENLPLESELINRCMECGFCEKNCPSKDITLTPRQRIAVLREVSRLNALNDFSKANQLLKEYEYYGVQTCAACSRCLDLCPLNIDTAKIALTLRKSLNAKFLPLAQKAYENFDRLLSFAKFGVSLTNGASRIFGEKRLSKISSFGHKFHLPYIPEKMPLANSYILESKFEFDEKIVYFSACSNRIFKPNLKSFQDQRSLQEVVESLCLKAQISVLYPSNLSKMCCGKFFENFPSIKDKNSEYLKAELFELSLKGKLRIVVDHSSCFYEMFKNFKDLQVLDLSEFLFSIASKLKLRKGDKRILVHKLCLLKKLDKAHFIEDLARLCSDEVGVIRSFECCGFAGDKGFFTPELNQSATRNLKFETKDYDLGVSSSCTCEIGLNSYCELDFVHIAYLLDALST